MQNSNPRPLIVFAPRQPANPGDKSADGCFADAYSTTLKTPPAKVRFRRRLISTLHWIGPTAVLVALPKCPLCLVGYVALITGAGVSMAVAETIRGAIVIASVALLVWFVVRKLLPPKCAGYR